MVVFALFTIQIPAVLVVRVIFIFGDYCTAVGAYHFVFIFHFLALSFFCFWGDYMIAITSTALAIITLAIT